MEQQQEQQIRHYQADREAGGQSHKPGSVDLRDDCASQIPGRECDQRIAHITNIVCPKRRSKANLVQEVRLDQKAGRGQRYDCRKDDPGDAVNRRPHQRQEHIDRRLKNRFVAVVPIQAQRFPECQNRAAHALDIVQNRQQQHRFHSQQILLTYPQSDERIEQEVKRNAAVAENPESRELNLPENIQQPCFRLGHAQIADARRDGCEELSKNPVQRADDQQIIGIEPDKDRADFHRNDDVVGGIDHDFADFLRHHRRCVLFYFFNGFAVQLLARFLLQERIAFVRTVRDEQVFQERAQDAQQQEIGVAPRQIQKENLQRIYQGKESKAVDRHDVALLIGDDQVALVGKKVGYCGIEDKQEEDPVEVLHVRSIRHEKVQKGDEADAQKQDEGADEEVSSFVELHQRLHFRDVLFGQRFVQAVDDRRADAQFNERKHRQDAGEESVDAEIFRAEDPDEDDAGDETHGHSHDFAHKRNRDIFQ